MDRLPDRVLDLEILGSSLNVKLVETDNEHAPYIALSHCWGSSQQFTTTTATLDARKTGISWDHLSKTFQDAISFTHRLKVRYLWVDSLCILQDDTNDWQRQASKMSSIYEHAFLTLAATNGRNSTDGCFTKASPEYQAREFSIYDRSGTAHQIFVRRHLPHWHLPHPQYPLSSYSEHFPLLDRAWVLQERLLSRRILHFGPHELIFECNEGAACECFFMNRIPKILQLKPTHVGTMMPTIPTELLVCGVNPMGRRWRELVEEYSRLKLTYESDRLPALSGLAQQANRTNNDQYIAGLWRSRLLDDLLWQTRGKPGHRPAQRHAPSWSWASVGRPIKYAIGVDSTPEDDITFVSRLTTSLDASTQSTYIADRSSTITITSQVLLASPVVYTQKASNPCHQPELLMLNTYESFNFAADYILQPTTACESPWDQSGTRRGKVVLIVRIAKKSCFAHHLVVDVVEKTNPANLIGERIGLLTETDAPPVPQHLPWNKAATRSITIR